jgi:hypothetical protein
MAGYLSLPLVMRFCLLIFSVFALLLLESCRREEPAPDINGAAYFPYRPGEERIYRVDSFLHSSLADSVEYRYRLMKEKVVSDEADLQGVMVNRIERWFSSDSGRTYFFHSLATCSRRADHAWWMEENRTWVKLSFPVRQNRSWDGNAYNAGGIRDFRYTRIRGAFNNGVQTFPATIEVQIQADSSFINRYIEKEVYAEDLGMVYRESVRLDFQPGADQANGHEAYIRLLSIRR